MIYDIIEEIDWNDNKRKYQTKAQKELNESKKESNETTDDLDGFNDTEEEETA